MNVRTYFAAIILAVLFAVSPIMAQETFDFDYGKVTLTVPSKWNFAIEGNSLQVSSPDEKVQLSFEVITVEELEEAATHMGEELAEAFPDIEIGEVEETKVNGMDLISVGGYCEGGKKYAGYDLIVTKNSKVLVVTGIIDSSMKEKYAKDVMNLYKSIKPLK